MRDGLLIRLSRALSSELILLDSAPWDMDIPF